MNIIVKNFSVEIDHFIATIDNYHRLLRRVYSIITIEIPGIKPDLAFKMAVRAINN